jgi:hypothetical protein
VNEAASAAGDEAKQGELNTALHEFAAEAAAAPDNDQDNR